MATTNDEVKAAGILLYAFKNNRLYFLLARTNPDEHKNECLFSDFGGYIDEGETPEEAALREFYEESMGSIMSQEEMKANLKDAKQYYNKKHQYLQYLVEIDYNEDIALVYNRIREFLEECGKASCSLDLKAQSVATQEKVELGWLSAKEMLEGPEALRPAFFSTWARVMHKYFT